MMEEPSRPRSDRGGWLEAKDTQVTLAWEVEASQEETEEVMMRGDAGVR